MTDGRERGAGGRWKYVGAFLRWRAKNERQTPCFKPHRPPRPEPARSKPGPTGSRRKSMKITADTVDWTMVKAVDLDERDTRSSLQLSSSDRTCLVCDGASDEAARKVDQQRSQSLGISKHTELAAFFYFGKSDAEQVGSREHFSIK